MPGCVREEALKAATRPHVMSATMIMDDKVEAGSATLPGGAGENPADRARVLPGAEGGQAHARKPAPPEPGREAAPGRATLGVDAPRTYGPPDAGGRANNSGNKYRRTGRPRFSARHVSGIELQVGARPREEVGRAHLVSHLLDLPGRDPGARMPQIAGAEAVSARNRRKTASSGKRLLGLEVPGATAPTQVSERVRWTPAMDGAARTAPTRHPPTPTANPVKA